jgi:hypothetical protein
MFEKAARVKLRFPFKGFITAEDLWDLTVTDLDSIYRSLHTKLKAAQEESLLGTKSKEDITLDLQIGIVKHIVEVKLQEAEDKKTALAKKAQKQKIMDIMATKQDAALEGKSIEELQKMLDEV